MADRKHLLERRKNPRYWVREGVVAIPRVSAARIGRIEDLSKEGLAVRYADGDDWLSGAAQIDLLVIGSDFYLSKIPVRMISICGLINKHSHGVTRERRWGLRFGAMSHWQTMALDLLIQDVAVGRVWDFTLS